MVSRPERGSNSRAAGPHSKRRLRQVAAGGTEAGAHAADQQAHDPFCSLHQFIRREALATGVQEDCSQERSQREHYAMLAQAVKNTS